MEPNDSKVTVYPHSTIDKTIQIEGPGELFLDIDYDDVNHDQVEKDLERLIALIEKYWDET